MKSVGRESVVINQQFSLTPFSCYAILHATSGFDRCSESGAHSMKGGGAEGGSHLFSVRKIARGENTKVMRNEKEELENEKKGAAV